ncbi:hypothetical protein IPH92_02780 [Candidatus Kaiserbacteria bacterium]|nr:MAG: hypothetical protein IPH92_02780 [Candidatus Kaiserbacteria bacterium]
MNRIFVCLAFCALIFIPVSAFAGPILRTGETISVDAAQSLKGDFYGFGSTVSISGQGDNDVYIAGGTVTINAPILEDLTVVGGVVQIHGDIGDDVRIVGGEVVLASPVKGDVVVFGGTLTILSTAQVEGDVLFMGQTLVIEGSVMGGIHGVAETARLNTEVEGDVSLRVENLFTVGDKANLQGNVTYESAHEVVRAQNAVVAGEMKQVQVREREYSMPTAQFALFELSILLFVALTLYVIGRRHVVRVVEYSFARLGMSGLMGLGILFAFPFIATLLFVSVLGIFAGIIFLFGYMLMILMALALMPIFVGYALQKVALRREGITLYTVIGGVALCVLLSLFSVAGGLILFACFVITLGALGTTAYHVLHG